MTATLYFHVGDAELRAEDAGGAVRIVAGNFDWTMLLENRLDCARWAKAIADADALFVSRRELPEIGEAAQAAVAAAPGHTDDDEPPTQSLADWDKGIKAYEDGALDDLEPLPSQRTPAGPPAHPWQAAMNAELSEEALAGAEPLETLAPEPEEDEARDA